uniref:Uncharacterized protein n=1 Tax=Anguilla anguilla TaxID=7936 RepID=A0A0E9P7X9_ANGAN
MCMYTCMHACDHDHHVGTSGHCHYCGSAQLKSISHDR